MTSLIEQTVFLQTQLTWLATGMAGLLVGFIAGLFYFRSLNIVARRLINGDLTAVGLQAVRFAALGLVLYGLTRFGAVALLAALAGIVLARSHVLAQEADRP